MHAAKHIDLGDARCEMRDATKASIHFRIRQGAGGRISNLESRIQYNHQPMNKYFFACAGIVALLTNVVVAGDRPATIEEFYETGGRTRVIAHRGFSGIAPENTLAAVRAAIEVGADMVEVDVTMTADGHVVCLHDETLDRTTDGQGLPTDLTLEFGEFAHGARQQVVLAQQCRTRRLIDRFPVQPDGFP